METCALFFDVSVQAQILRLLMQANKEQNVAMLFISHDLRVVYEMCDHVLIMQQGQIRESGDVEEVYFHHKDPYTGRLLKAAGILV